MTAFSQTFKCPTISYRNNGNNANCPGEQVTDKKGVTTTPVAVNAGLSTYSLPTTTKEGTITMEFDQKYSDVPTLGSVSSAGSTLSVEFGPPSEWTTKTNSYALDYCFYNQDLPAAGKLFVMVINKGNTTNSYGTCTYDGQTLVVAPAIVTQPVSKLNICKGDNYTFSCSATAQGNNTTLSYQWKKDGTNISGATTSSYSLSGVSNANNGDYTVVVTETYSNGNAISQESSKAKLLVDAIKPTVATQNVTLNLDASGSASIAPSQINNGSTDNCTISSYTLDKTSFNCNNLGSNTVILTVTDNNGNSATAAATVTVLDAIAPIAKAKNYTVNLDASGSATITLANIEDGSTDNCSVVKSTLDNYTFGCNNLGDNTVTLTVEDASGNTSSTTATVTVVDAIAPVAKAKNYTVNLDASGVATIEVANIEDGSTDNCSVVKSTLDNYTFGCNNLGENTVTLTVEDASGNTNSTTATVTVVDAIAPIAKAKNYTVNLNASGVATIEVANIEDGSTDNCSVTSKSLSKTSFDCSNRGENTVTLTVSDASGNTNSTTATVTVVDAIAPVARTKNIDVIISNGADVTIAAADIENGSTDNCSIVSTDLAGQVKFGCADRGKTFTVTLTVKDASGNSNSANATVTVKGSATIAPVVSHDFKGLNNDGRYFFPYHSEKVKFTTSTQTGYSYAWTGNDISGSTSGSSIYVLPSKKGKLTLTATATDANGCTASSTGNICVFDIAVPNTSNSKVYVCHDKGSNAVGASGYVTVEVSISGAKSHLTQHSKDAIGTCGETYSCSNLSGRSKLADDNSEVGQLMDLGEHTSVLVYPNPSSDVFMIELESDEITTVSDVIITDMAGRVVESVKINPNVAIEVGRDLIPGIYNIQVKNGATVSSSRLVKK
ncbi:MAG: hypothetical protein RLZZ47_90 [Bacteroidota bacterium]